MASIDGATVRVCRACVMTLYIHTNTCLNDYLVFTHDFFSFFFFFFFYHSNIFTDNALRRDLYNNTSIDLKGFGGKQFLVIRDSRAGSRQSEALIKKKEKKSRMRDSRKSKETEEQSYKVIFAIVDLAK